MEFKMLDDDDFGTEQNSYVPSSIVPSRTGSMKKFAKKQDRPNTATTLQKPAALKPVQKDEFDDLLNQLIDSKQKSTKRPQTSIMSTQKKNNSLLDDLKFSNDSGFGQKQSITFNFQNQKTLPKPLDSSKFNQMTSSKDTFKLSDDFGTSTLNNKHSFIIPQNEDTSPLRSRRESSLRKDSPKNIIIQDDSPSITIGSSRMMRPPMGRKPSVHLNQNQNKQQFLGLSINDQSSKLSQTADAAKFPSRRGSNAAQTPKQNFGFNKDKQEYKFNLQSSDEAPQLSRQSSSHFPQRSSQDRFLNQKQSSKIQQKPTQRIIQKIIQRVVQAPKIDMSAIKSQHQKQINLIKQSYQKQIKILTDNYQRQLRQQKQAKNKMMNDQKQMLQRQREKNEKYLRQETQRVKKMNDWQKQKLQSAYQSQIQRLKSTIQSQQKRMPQPSISYLQKRKIEDLQQKLKYQLDNVENQKKKLSRLQSDLEQRQSEFNKFRLLQQKRLKEENSKINDKTFKDLKRISDQKNQIAAQKQKMALEMAQMEMEIIQKQQKLYVEQENIRAQQESFQRMKQDSQGLNQQLYNNYKQKLQQAQQSKNNALILQNDLINKLKIVQLKGKQVYKKQIDNPIFRNTFQPHKSQFVPVRPQSVTHSRFVPDDNSKRVKNVQNYIRNQGLNLSNTSKMTLTNNNTSFTLDKFIKNVDGYKKEKKHMIY